jgi:flagellar basal body rod protein FlgC
MVMNILPIAASALSAASTATAIRADNIANIVTPEYTRKAPVYHSIPNGGVAVSAQETSEAANLVLDIVGLRSALQSYKAAATLVETGAELNKALLDSVA